MTDHDYGIDMTDEKADAFCAALADMRPRHVEPLGWVLVDQWTRDRDVWVHRSRAVNAARAWVERHPDKAGRFVVCALVPDGSSSRGAADLLDEVADDCPTCGRDLSTTCLCAEPGDAS